MTVTGPTAPTTLRSAVTTLAVVVTSGTTPYLDATLRALAAQTRTPDTVLVVDCASRDNGLGDGTPVEDVVDSSGLDEVTTVRIVRAPQATGTISATRTGLAGLRESLARHAKRRALRAAQGQSEDSSRPTFTSRPGIADAGAHRGPARPVSGGSGMVPASPGSGEAGGSRSTRTTTDRIWQRAQVESSAVTRSAVAEREEILAAALDGTQPGDTWLWLLHDDSAPAPTCLAELLAVATNARSVAMAGPKQVNWDHPDQLLEVGLRTTASARRANDVIEGEIDQGQHDGRSDVLAVGTPGALISLESWLDLPDELDKASIYTEGLLLSHVLRRRGGRVVVVPRAVLRHRRASYHGQRAGAPSRSERAQRDEAERLERGHDSSFRARRVAQLRAWGAMSGKPVSLLALWFVVLGFMRAAWRLLTKEPALARDEVAAACVAARSPRAMRRLRKAIGRGASVSRSVVAELYMPASQIRAARRDRARQLRERLAREAAPSELELRELAYLARQRRAALLLVTILSLTVGLVGLAQVIATRTVAGGGLATLGDQWHAQWEAAWDTWAPSADGYSATLTPVLAMAAVLTFLGTLVGGDGDMMVHLLLLATVPLAGVGAWFASGTLTRRPTVRAWAALVWACAPTLLFALGQGRLGPVVIHLLLPWSLLALMRAVGADRRDVIQSGLVGARHLSESERAELDRLASETIESLGELSDAEDDPQLPRGRSGDPSRAGIKRELAHLDEEAEAAGLPAAHHARDAVSAQAVSPEDTGSQTSSVARTESGVAILSDAAVSGDESELPATEPATDLGEVSLRGELRRRRPRLRPLPSAALEAYGTGSIAAAGVAALILTAIVAIAPVIALVVAPMLVLVALWAHHRRTRLVMALIPVVATVAPAYAHAARLAVEIGGQQGLHAAASYLLADTGVPLAVEPPAGLGMLAGLPVALSSLKAVSPVLPLALAGAGLVLVLLALLGLLTGGKRGHRARAGLLLAVAGWALAALAVRHVVAVGADIPGDSTQLVAGWAGTGLSLVLAGLLAAATQGADAALASLSRHGLGWRHGVVLILGVAAVLAPVTTALGWAIAAHRAPADGNVAMALRAGSQSVPVIAQEMQNTGAGSRVLALHATADGIEAAIWRGDGTTVFDATPAVLSAQLLSRLHDDSTLYAPLSLGTRRSSATASQALGAGGAELTVSSELSDAADADLAQIVARAVSGQDETVAAELAQHGIAVVLLANNSGDETTARAWAGLAATPNLETLAQTAVGTAWRVAPTYSGDVASTTLVDSQGRLTPLIPTHRTDAEGSSLTVTLPASKEARTLLLAERASSRWQAEVDGTELTPTSSPVAAWQQAFTVPAGTSGTLTISTQAPSADVATWIMWATWALAALMALPVRRRRTSA